jgi:hypothetical protein
MTESKFTQSLRANWEAAEFDVNTDKGVYFKIKGYLPVREDKPFDYARLACSKSGFHNMIRHLFALDEDLHLYGFRRTIPKEILASPNFVSLDEYCKQMADKFTSNLTYMDNYFVMAERNVIDMSRYDHGALKKFRDIINLHGDKMLPLPSDVKKVAEALKVYTKALDEFKEESCYKLYDLYQMLSGNSVKLKGLGELVSKKTLKNKKLDGLSISQMSKTIKKAYPMLDHGYYHGSQHLKNEDVDYINGINYLIKNKKRVSGVGDS